jgi:hypothetical protein
VSVRVKIIKTMKSCKNTIKTLKIRLNLCKSVQICGDFLLYTCRAASTNPPFLKKQTQFSPFLAQKLRFAEKTNPIQTQTNPIIGSFLGQKRRFEKNKPNTNPNIGNLGNMGCSLKYTRCGYLTPGRFITIMAISAEAAAGIMLKKKN